MTSELNNEVNKETKEVTAKKPFNKDNKKPNRPKKEFLPKPMKVSVEELFEHRKKFPKN